MDIQRESMDFDVVIIGAGPAGLATAIHLADLAKAQQRELSICILEKGAYVGAHIISGAVLETDALTELMPDWQAQNAPVTVKAKHSQLLYLSATKHWPLPQIPMMHGKNNYIISLGELCKWLGEQAEQKDVNIFPGFPAAEILYNEANTAVIGVQTVDMGLDKQGNPTDQFQAGINILGKQTIFAEGCRGSLTETLIDKFELRKACDMQSYALGIKELWRIAPEKHDAGAVIHTVGVPLNKVYGGGFIYHFKDNLISVGLVAGLDYKDPLFDPFDVFQQFKQHPYVKRLLDGGECISYGARALNEGGYQCIPQLTVPGASIVGCAAGFVNVGKIKGIHNALRSGMLVAKALIEKPLEELHTELTSYTKNIKQSSIYKELYHVRNIRPSFHRGNWFGMLYSAFDQFILRGRAPYTLHYKIADHDTLHKQTSAYQAPSFKQRLNAVYLTGTKHREDEPCHLKLKDPSIAINVNYKQYNGPESRYCPAGVYEFIEENGTTRLQINAANCIHCKTCDIKDPKQNIKWTVPEGGDGPNYQLM